ncbi:class I SAM-dependent methyltransferase [Microbacterium sp. 1.5R]|uniref:class I SAM-dependent DNA methyltransferase n=1 Tax=Microbacterium sp. 1.5R TaxID=1916917 RepID=UPI0021B38335|nr:class I SAM-dependent methyltransferase [Microbacterium sp. 1.5R]
MTENRPAAESRRRRTDPRDTCDGDANLRRERDVIAAAYDERAAEYEAVGGRLSQMDPRDVATIRSWRDATAGPVLDAGCGPGHWTAFLAEGGRDVRGVDLSREFVASARRSYPGILFETGSFHELSVGEAALGGILAWYSLIHTSPADLPAVFGEFARVLRRDGSLLIGFFDGEPGEPFPHAVTTAYFWSAEALGILLVDAGFEVVASERRERVPGEMSTRPHGALIARRV